jgi:hypothetical protein
MSGILGTVLLDAVVHRTKQNYRIICLAKLAELPQGEPGGQQWMQEPNTRLGGITPNDAIEDGNGHVAEALVEELVHRHEAFTALAELHRRYRDVADLSDVWDRFMDALTKEN